MIPIREKIVVGGGLRKPEAVPATVIFENLPPPTSSAIFISRGATEESLEDVLAILEADCSDQEVDVTEDEEQQRRRRPHGSDAYQTELLQDNGFKIIEETMATLDMDDLSSVGSSDEESSDASDEDDLQFLEYCTQIKIVASCEFLKSIICSKKIMAILFEEAGNISVLESALSEAEGSFSATDRHQEGVHESEKHRPPKTYTQPEAEKPKPKVRKCRHGAKCIHLKRGPGKCNFFHPPEEVAMYHPPSTSSRASQAKSTIPKRDKKRAKECSYGLNCKLLRKGPTICPFYHSPKEIYVFHPNAQISATDASVEASKTHFYSSVLHSSSQVESNNVIDANAAPRVVGKNKKHIRNMMKKSGTTISLTPKVDSNGRCMVHITGSTDQADKEAANMVVEASLRAFTFLESPEEISIMSVLTGDEVSLPTQPLSVTPTSSNKTGAEQLLSFFEQQKSFLKVPPKKFYNWLKSDDIDSFEAFVEACSDEDYQAEMQANGLKGFKRRPFFKAVKVAAGSG